MSAVSASSPDNRPLCDFCDRIASPISFGRGPGALHLCLICATSIGARRLLRARKSTGITAPEMYRITVDLADTRTKVSLIPLPRPANCPACGAISKLEPWGALWICRNVIPTYGGLPKRCGCVFAIQEDAQ